MEENLEPLEILSIWFLPIFKSHHASPPPTPFSSCSCHRALHISASERLDLFPIQGLCLTDLFLWNDLTVPLIFAGPQSSFRSQPKTPIWRFWNDLWRPFSFLSFFLKIFIYLVLNCSSQDLWSSLLHMEYLVVACGIQFPDQGSNPNPPVLGVWSLYFLLIISHSFTLTVLWSMEYLFPPPQTYESYVPPIKYKFYLTLVTWIFLKI